MVPQGRDNHGKGGVAAGGSGSGLGGSGGGGANHPNNSTNNMLAQYSQLLQGQPAMLGASPLNILNMGGLNMANLANLNNIPNMNMPNIPNMPAMGAQIGSQLGSLGVGGGINMAGFGALNMMGGQAGAGLGSLANNSLAGFNAMGLQNMQNMQNMMAGGAGMGSGLNTGLNPGGLNAGMNGGGITAGTPSATNGGGIKTPPLASSGGRPTDLLKLNQTGLAGGVNAMLVANSTTTVGGNASTTPTTTNASVSMGSPLSNPLTVGTNSNSLLSQALMSQAFRSTPQQLAGNPGTNPANLQTLMQQQAMAVNQAKQITQQLNSKGTVNNATGIDSAYDWIFDDSTKSQASQPVPQQNAAAPSNSSTTPPSASATISKPDLDHKKRKKPQASKPEDDKRAKLTKEVSSSANSSQNSLVSTPQPVPAKPPGSSQAEIEQFLTFESADTPSLKPAAKPQASTPKAMGLALPPMATTQPQPHQHQSQQPQQKQPATQTSSSKTSSSTTLAAHAPQPQLPPNMNPTQLTDAFTKLRDAFASNTKDLQHLQTMLVQHAGESTREPLIKEALARATEKRGSIQAMLSNCMGAMAKAGVVPPGMSQQQMAMMVQQAQIFQMQRQQQQQALAAKGGSTAAAIAAVQAQVQAQVQAAAAPPPPVAPKPTVNIMGREEFDVRIMKCKIKPINLGQRINAKPVDYYTLFYVVLDFGGYDEVQLEKKWKDVAERMLVLQPVSAPTALRKFYSQNLIELEKELYPNAKEYKGANPRFIPPGIIGPEPEPPAKMDPPAAYATPQLAATSGGTPNSTAVATPPVTATSLPRTTSNSTASRPVAPKPSTSASSMANVLLQQQQIAAQRQRAAVQQQQQKAAASAGTASVTGQSLASLGFTTYGQQPGRSTLLEHQMALTNQIRQVEAKPLDLNAKFPKYGGLEVEKLYALAPRAKAMVKNQLGACDLYNVSQSLLSTLHIDVTSALNILTIISHDREVVLKLPDFPPLGLAMIHFLKLAVDELLGLLPDLPSDGGKPNSTVVDNSRSRILPLKNLLYLEAKASAMALTAVDAQSCLPDRRKVLMEQMISILTVFRNLTANLEPNQKFLGTNCDFVESLMHILRISPLSDSNDILDDLEDFSIETIPEEEAELVRDIASEYDLQTEDVLFREAASLTLELRRLSVSNLTHVSQYIRLSNATDAQTVIHAMSDALETHTHFIDSNPSVSTAWNNSSQSVIHTGEELHPHLLMEGLCKLFVDLNNADLFGECEGLESLLLVCVGMLPQAGGGFTIAVTLEDVISWELALSLLNHLVIVMDGLPGEPPKDLLKAKTTGGNLNRTTPTHALRGSTRSRYCDAAKSRYSSLTKVPILVPVLISMLRRPNGSAANAAALAQVDPLCIKACRVLTEAVMRGGNEARAAVRKFHAVLLGIGMGGVHSGMGEEVWRKVIQILSLLNDSE